MSRGQKQKNPKPRPAKIVIPDLIGMIVSAAMNRAVDVGFALALADHSAPIQELVSSGRWVVADQDPRGAAVRYQGDTVVVFLRHDDGGGGAGDREPRNPLPLRRSGLALPLDQADDQFSGR